MKPNQRASVDAGFGVLFQSYLTGPAPLSTFVRLKSMRAILATSLFICGLVFGCAHRLPHASSGGSLPSDASASVLLDNHGGFSHAGRRVALQRDGSYTDTRYTDVIGDQKTERGTYTFDPEKRRLTLSARKGKVETLRRVDYRGEHYWVQEQHTQRVADPVDAWFRQISLRAETR
jgi:hypothetical protein